MKKQKFLGLAICLCSFMVCIILVELFLRFFAPVPDPYNKYYQPLNQYIKFEHKPNYSATTELEAELPGADGQNHFSTNNMGFRGDHLNTPKPENEYRIFIIGPSNVECFYLDDSESIDAVLQDELNKNAPDNISIKVYNAGNSAINSDDYISMLVHRIIHLEPDMIIINGADLYAPMRDHDYLHYLKDSPNKKFPLLHFFATEFQIPRRIYYLIKKIAPSEEELAETVTLKSRYLQAIEKFRKTAVSDEKPKTNIPAYTNNLLTIIGVSRAHGIKLVFMTHESTWNSKVDPEVKKWHWGLYYNGIRFREDVMQETLKSYFNAMQQLAAEYSVPLFDIAELIPKSTEYFYDDVHFNTNGADFAGRHLASFILQEGLIQR